jgi:hypothetical protein
MKFLAIGLPDGVLGQSIKFELTQDEFIKWVKSECSHKLSSDEHFMKTV